jgi:hypothetical protein
MENKESGHTISAVNCYFMCQVGADSLPTLRNIAQNSEQCLSQSLTIDFFVDACPQPHNGRRRP